MIETAKTPTTSTVPRMITTPITLTLTPISRFLTLAPKNSYVQQVILLQLFAARFAVLSTDSSLSTTVEAFEFCVLNVDGSDSEPDREQNCSADDGDDDAHAEDVFEHGEQCEHDMCCLNQNLR
jgi:hypothetical protein